VWILGLFGHVYRVLESDERIEGEGRAAQDRDWNARAGFELEGAARIPVAACQRSDSDDDDDQLATELDEREAEV
jgi:hypothetical protein